jgi:DNA-binding beta-propeller fold protein YncE
LGKVVDPRIARSDFRNLTPRIFIASEGYNGVEVWQGEPPQKIALIPSGGVTTHNLGVSNNARWVVSSNRYTGNVTVYDTQTLTVTAKIAVGPAPHDMAWSPDDTRLYISLESAPYIAVIDTATWKTLAPILVDTPTHDLTIITGGKEMWATGIKYRGLLFIDLEQNKLVSTYKYFPEGSHDAYYRPQDDEVWLSSSGFIGGPQDANPNIVIFDRATRKIKDTRPYGLYPFHSGKRFKDTVYFPKNDNEIMWFSDRGWSPKVGRGKGGVLAIDVKSRQVVKYIPTGNGPFHISYGPNGWLYLINQDDSTLSVVDTDKMELVRTIKVAPSPHGVSVVGVEN